jgi:hypothetical protein
VVASARPHPEFNPSTEKKKKIDQAKCSGTDLESQLLGRPGRRITWKSLGNIVRHLPISEK